MRLRTWLCFIGGGSSLVLRTSLGEGRAHQAPGPRPLGEVEAVAEAVAAPVRRPLCARPLWPVRFPGSTGCVCTGSAAPVRAKAARPAHPGPRSTGCEAGPGHTGTLLPDAPHTCRGRASAAWAPHPLTRHLEGEAAGQGARAGSSRAGTAHQASPGHPQLAGDLAAVMTGCVHTCVSVLQLTWAHSSPEPPRADQPAPPHHSPLPCSHGPLVLKPLGEHEVGCCGQGRATRRLCP